MPAKRKGAFPKQPLKTEKIVLLTGVAAAIFISVSMAVFYPSGTWALPLWLLGLFIGIGTFLLFVALWGGVLGFRHHTPKVVAGNRRWEASWSMMLQLDPVYYPLDKGALEDPSLTPGEREDMEKALAVTPGLNDRGEKVEVWALPLGGFRWYSFYSYPGEDGFIIFFGMQYFRFYENVIIPYNVQRINHDEVPRKMLIQLEEDTHGVFKPYESALYICTELNPGYAAYLRTSPEARHIQVESMGIAGLARQFANYVRRQVGFEDVRFTSEQILPLLHPWLEKKGLYTEAVVKGYADAQFQMNKALGLQAKLTQTEHENTVLRDTIQWYIRAMSGDAKRRSGTYQGGYAQTRPAPDSYEDERARHPGLDRSQPFDGT